MHCNPSPRSGNPEGPRSIFFPPRCVAGATDPCLIHLTGAQVGVGPFPMRETISTPDALHPWPPVTNHYKLCFRCQTVHDARTEHKCATGYHYSPPPSLAAAVAFLGLLAVFLGLVGVCLWCGVWILDMVGWL